MLHFAHLLPTPERVETQRRVLQALGFRATVDKTADGLLEVTVELRLSAGQQGLWFMPEESAETLQAALSTGLMAPGAGPGMEVPVSESALTDFLRERATHLTQLPLPVPEAAAGTVRFVTTG